MLLCVAVLLVVPEEGYRIIALILSVVLIVNGIRYLIFYFSMARNMVDGKLTLTERYEDYSLEQIKEATEAEFAVAEDLKVLAAE